MHILGGNVSNQSSNYHPKNLGKKKCKLDLIQAEGNTKAAKINDMESKDREKSIKCKVGSLKRSINLTNL